MEKKIQSFNYLHSDVQFVELLPHLLNSLFFSPSLLKFVRVCVFIFACVWIFFLCVRSTYQSLVLPNKQTFETYIYIYIYRLQGGWLRQNLCQNTHDTPWQSKPLYTPSKIIQEALSPLIFFTLHFTEFGRPTEPGCFGMRRIWNTFVETEVICK
jgi:hypothetical protein